MLLYEMYTRAFKAHQGNVFPVLYWKYVALVCVVYMSVLSQTDIRQVSTAYGVHPQIAFAQTNEIQSLTELERNMIQIKMDEKHLQAGLQVGQSVTGWERIERNDADL